MRLKFIRVKVVVGDLWLGWVPAGFFITDDIEDMDLMHGSLGEECVKSLLVKSNWIESEWNRFPEPGPNISWFEEVTFELKEIEVKPL